MKNCGATSDCRREFEFGQIGARPQANGLPHDQLRLAAVVGRLREPRLLLRYAPAALGAEPVGSPPRGHALAGRRPPRSPALARGARRAVEGGRREPQAVPRHHDVRAVARQRPQAPARSRALRRSDLRLGHRPRQPTCCPPIRRTRLRCRASWDSGVDKPRESFIARPHARASHSADISFPGGNDGIQRCIVKWLNPEAIEGSAAVPGGAQRPHPVRPDGSAEHAVSDARWRDGRARRSATPRAGSASWRRSPTSRTASCTPCGRGR